ncbi:MAG: hypothetical protein AB2693_26560 [Candidatus Thiodiazotropha sp.]
MKEFYLTLLSDSSMNMFPNNTQSSFTVRLDHPLKIDRDTWEVALVEIITPSEVTNISENNNFFFLTFLQQETVNKLGMQRTKELCASGQGCYEYKLFLPEGNYSSPQHLVDEIQSVIDTNHGPLLTKINASIRITYVKSSNRLKVIAQNSKQVRVRFPASLGEMLGVNPSMSERPVGNENYAFKYEVDLNTIHSRLYVYSDIVDYTYLGDVTAPILRVVPFNTSKTSQQSHKEFVNMHYVPVAKSFIDQVHISIRGDAGQAVPFSHGKTLIKLHFRERVI